MNFVTMVKHLLRDAHVNYSVPGISDPETQAKICICRACVQSSILPFHFNKKLARLVFPAEESSVLLPYGFLRICSPVTVVGEGGAVRGAVVVPATSEDKPGYVSTFDMRIGAITSPAVWASEGRLHIIPTPQEKVEVQFEYVRDIGHPTFRGTAAGDINFYDSLTGNELTDDYTSHWFSISYDGGYELIFNKAMMILWSGVLGGTEEAATRAASYAAQYEAEKTRLRMLALSVNVPDSIRRWM